MQKGILITLLASSLLAGCGGDKNVKSGIKHGTGYSGNDASTQGIADGQGLAGTQTQGLGGIDDPNSPLNDPNSPLSQRIIYFMYDSSEIQPEYRSVVQAHAEYLSANPGLAVVVEGHADERGSREYNIALGEQRAHSVAKVLRFQGVGDNQMRSISYGEEKPLEYGHDEASWNMNRRAEISYRGY